MKFEGDSPSMLAQKSKTVSAIIVIRESEYHLLSLLVKMCTTKIIFS